MNFLYNLGIHLLGLAFRSAAFFNPKARLWVRGQRRLFERMRQTIDPQAPLAWFHAASLGEFEQGRPVIEAFRAKHPEYRILLTFFSPSGYEIRKDYTGADYVFYLPLDTPRNARLLAGLVNPKIAVFIKYEFWRNHLRVVRAAGARVFCVSAIFPEGSAFFNPVYGRWYRKSLAFFEHIFVQDNDSLARLIAVGVRNATVAGDTRFDRVWAIARQAGELPVLASFASDGRPLFIAGSTWPPDEELIVRLIDESPETKFVIAPHEIHPERIEKLLDAIGRKTIRYTQWDHASDRSAAEVLLLDTIGILSSVYRYGRYGYVGGGFGVGIHNTLEAAAFGLPLVFGPNYAKFQEAKELITRGGARSIADYRQLKDFYTTLRDDAQAWEKASEACREYVEEGRGATERILSQL